MINNDNFNICLTENEKIILSYIAHGFSNQEIGCRLCMNKNTVQGHVANILKKTATANRTMAVYKLTKLNYI